MENQREDGQVGVLRRRIIQLQNVISRICRAGVDALIRVVFVEQPTLSQQLSASSKQLFLEGLRGLAALTVYLVHALHYFYPSFQAGAWPPLINTPTAAMLGGTPLRIVIAGGFAVYVFWALSGYVLTLRILKDMARTDTVGRAVDVVAKALLRRYVRLVMPVFVACLLAFILAKAGAYASVQGVYELTRAGMIPMMVPLTDTFRDLIYHAFFEVWYLPVSLYVPAMWTMHYELLGSFAVILAATVVMRVRNVMWAYFGTFFFLIVIGETRYVDNYVFSGYLIMFFAGLLMAHLHVVGFFQILHLVRLPVRVVVYTLLALISLHAAMLPPFPGTISNWWIDAAEAFFLHRNVKAVSTAGAPLLVFLTLCSPVLQRVLSTRLCVFLGRISFGLYLTHLLVLSTMTCEVFAVLYWGHSWSYDAAVWMALLTSFPPTMVLAYLFTVIADERLGVRLSLFLVDKLHTPNNAASVYVDIEMGVLDERNTDVRPVLEKDP
eukprot:TRINITY_DN5280_c0_g1_i1.p1 TRINITY_DN5280_c0_g1~~TRINITY_DN5280_c0_g1_i1.p1  ORF type:complete len:513 (+),score=58.89 TRINITY_DN5280_c0_g1_i1:59-1540(+)